MWLCTTWCSGHALFILVAISLFALVRKALRAIEHKIITLLTITYFTCVPGPFPLRKPLPIYLLIALYLWTARVYIFALFKIFYTLFRLALLHFYLGFTSYHREIKNKSRVAISGNHPTSSSRPVTDCVFKIPQSTGDCVTSKARNFYQVHTSSLNPHNLAPTVQTQKFCA